MQALGSYKGGIMLFLGLGTGLGTTMIVDGIVGEATYRASQRSIGYREIELTDEAFVGRRQSGLRVLLVWRGGAEPLILDGITGRGSDERNGARGVDGAALRLNGDGRLGADPDDRYPLRGASQRRSWYSSRIAPPSNAISNGAQLLKAARTASLPGSPKLKYT